MNIMPTAFYDINFRRTQPLSPPPTLNAKNGLNLIWPRLRILIWEASIQLYHPICRLWKYIETGEVKIPIFDPEQIPQITI